MRADQNRDVHDIRDNAIAGASLPADQRAPVSFDPALMRSLVDALADYAEQTKPAAGAALRAGAGNAALNAVSEAVYALVTNAASTGQAFDDVHSANNPLLKPTLPGYDQQQYNGAAAVALGQLAQSTAAGLVHGFGLKSDFDLPPVSADLKASLRAAAAQDGRMNDAQVEQFQDGLRNMNPAQALSVAQFAEKVAKDNPQSHAAGQLTSAAFEVAAAKAENFFGLPAQNPDLLAAGERNRAGGVANWLSDAALGNQESTKTDGVLSKAQRGRDAWAPVSEQTSAEQPHRPGRDSQQPSAQQRAQAGTNEVLTSSLRLLVEKAASAGMASTEPTKVEPGQSKADFMQASMFSGRQINISAVIATFNVMAASLKDLQSHQLGMLPKEPATNDRPASSNALDGLRAGVQHLLEKAPGKIVDGAVGQALADSALGAMGGTELKPSVYPGGAVNGMARIATAAAAKELVALINKPATQLISDHAAGKLLDQVRNAADQVPALIGNAEAAQRGSDAAAARSDALLERADIKPDDVRAAVADIRQHAAAAREAASGLREATGSAPQLVELAEQVAQKALKAAGLADPHDQRAVRDQLNSPQAGDVPAAKRDAISALDLCKAARDALPRLDQAAQRAEQAADAAQAQPQRLAEHFGDVAAGAAHEAAQLTRMAQQAAGEAQDAADAAARAIGPLRKEDATLRADAAAERANELADRADRQAGLADRAAENAGAAAGNLGHDPANPAVAVQVDARTPAQEAAHQALQQAAAARADADSAGTAAGNAQRAAPGRDSDSTASDSADSPRHSASSGSDSSLFSSDSSDWRLSDSSRMDSLRSGLNDFLDSIDEQPQHGSETSSRGGSAARSAPELASMLTPEQADRLAELQEALERNGGASTSKDAAEQRVLEAAARGEIAPQELLDALRGTGADATDARNRSSDRAADQSRSADADRMQLGHGLPLTYDKTTKQLQTPDGKPLTNEFLAQHEGQTISIEVNGRAKDANVVAVQDRFGDKHFAVEVKGTGGDLLSPEGRQVNKNKLGQASDDGRSFVVLSLPGGAKQGSAAGESDKTHNMAKGAQGMADRANQAAQRAEQAQGDAADLGDSATRSQVQPLHNTANAQAAVAHKAADNANTKAASAKQEALAACEKAGITSNQQLEDLNRKNKKDPESLSANEKNALSAATHYQQAKASAVTADASAAKAKQASDQVATRLQNAAPDPKADATKPQAGDKDAEPARIGGQRLDNGDAEQRRIMSSLLRSDEDLKKQLEAIKVKRGDLPDLDTRALAHDLAQRARNGDSVSLTQQDVNLLTKLYDKLPQDSENKHGARLGVGLSNEQLKGLQAELSKGDDGVFDRNTLTQVADLGRSSKADDGDKGTQRNHRVGNSAVSSIAEVAAALAQTASPQTLDKMKPLLSDVAQTVGNMSEKQAGELVDRLMNKEASPGERKSAAMDFVEQVADTAHNLRIGEIDTLGNAMDANRTSAGDATPRSQRDMDTLKEVGKKIDAVINDLPKDAQEAHALKGLADLMDAAVQPNAKGESSSQAAGLEFGADPGKAGITQRDAKPKPDGAQTDTATRGQSAADGASTSSAASSDPAGQSNQGADTRSAATDRSAPQDAADGAKPTPTSSGPKGETVNADPAAQRSPQTKPDTTQTDTATPTQRAGDGAVDSAGTTTAADPNRGAASGATTTTRNPGQTDGADAGATGVGEPPPGYPKPGETLSDRTGGGGTKTDRSAQSTSADGADGDKSGAKAKSGGSSAGRGTDDIARNVDGEDEILENPDADLDVGNQVEDNTTGAGAGASGSAGVTRTEDGGYAAAAEGRAGATAQAGGSFDEGAVSGSGSVQVGPEASGKASAHAGPTEVEGSVQGEVSAAKAEGEVTVGNDNVNGTVGGSATAGAGGEASAGVSTTGASAKVDAFAGAEATASAGGSVAGGAATGKAEAGALVGVGAGAGANVGVDDGVLTVGGNLKLALGIGLSIDFSLKIDFNKIFGKEKNPFEDIAKGLNELNGGKTQYSGAQLEFYARAYVKDTPDGMTAEQLLQKMSDDGLLSKGPDGTVALGGTPTTANGQHSLATSILSTGGGAGATSVNADGLAKALNFANRGDTETTQKAQAMINLYGNGQTIDEAGLKRAMADGALAYGNAESIYNGQKETTWGLKMQADTNKLSDASMGQMLGSAGTDGKTLAATINNMNSQYYGSKEAYVGDHQAQFALNGYTSYGMSSQDAVNQMIKDKVIVRTPSGELNLDYGAMVTNAHSADPTAAANGQHRLASSLLVSGGAATDGSLDAKGLTNALNMANRGDASYGPQMDQMVKRYGGADGRVDHNELQAMVRDGAINMGPIQTTFNGQVENTTGISVSAPSMAGKTSYQITNDIVQTTGLDGAVDPTELTGWCAPGQTIEQVNVLAHGYSRDGQLRADGLQAMIDDGVLVVGGDGKLRANPKAAFDNAHSADPAKATLGQERLSMMLTTHGSDSSDTSSQYYMDRDGAEVPERITSAEDTALAMNQLAGREVVTADQVPGMLSSFTQFNNTDHSNLRENNTRYAVATGAIYWDPATGGPALNTAAYA